MSRTRTTVSAALAATALIALPRRRLPRACRSLSDDVFSPSAKTISKGTKVTFKWKGESPHDVIATKNGKRYFTIGIRSSGTVTKTFRSKGTYKLICSIHTPDMKATIKVR